MPYKIEDIMEALRKADEAGNKEDAQGLAIIADRMRKKSPQAEPKLGIIPSMAVGIEQTMAGSLTKTARQTGILPPVEGKTQKLPEYVGRGIGEVASFLIPGGVLTKTLAKGTGLASNISKNILDAMAKHPWITTASEITGGVGMGAGEFVGEEITPEAKGVGAMIGGTVGSLAPTAAGYTPTMLASKAVRGLAKKISLPFSEPGATYRAGEFLKKQVADPAAVVEVLAKESMGVLPPVAMTGENRLMGLYNQIRNLDPIKDAKAINQITQSAFKLEQEMRLLGRGSPEILKAMTEKRIASIELGMDNRIAKRMEIAQQRIDSLPVAQRQSQESIIVRNELTKVMHQEKALEQELWRAVPKKAIVGVKNTKGTFTKISEELATAQKSDIPTVLRNHTVLEEHVKSTTVKEMQGLRSKLLEISRQARANSQWNKSRIAEDVADAILEDMTISAKKTITPEGELLKTALAGTKQFKQRFEQGTVGKILGYERTSAPSIAPELTLDIATRGKGIVDINKVVVTPEAKAATEKYIARSFTDYSLDPNGVVNPLKTQKFLRNNEELLDSFPNLRKQIENIGEAQKLATATKNTMEARRAKLRDPKISVAGRFLNANIGDEVKGILKSPNPAMTMKQLVNQARKDTTGQAVKGLRGGFIEHILDNSSIGGFNDLGERTLSGRAMLGFMKDNNDVLNQVFSPEQMGRMNRIGQELAKIEALEKIKGINIEYSDAVSNMLKFASRFGGAAVGRHWGKMVGAGGTVQIPGFFAQQWYKIMSHLTKNRFENLVSDAIMSPDGKLLQSLLLPISKPGVTTNNNLKTLNQRMNLWLVGSGRRVMEDVMEDMNALPAESR